MDGSSEEVTGLLFNEVTFAWEEVERYCICIDELRYEVSSGRHPLRWLFPTCFFNIPLFSVATRSCESNSRIIQPKIESLKIEKQPWRVVTLYARVLSASSTTSFSILPSLSYVYERNIKKILRIVRVRRLERYQQTTGSSGINVSFFWYYLCILIESECLIIIKLSS